MFAGSALAVAVAAIVAVAVALASASSAPKPPSLSPSCVPPQLNVSAALAGERVTVSPEPQSRDASAGTQISMLGVPASELAGVTVTGSHTGAHSGRLEAYSQGDGASFLPSHPFADGELVTVHAELLEGGHAVPFAWSFTVAVRDDPGSQSAAVGTGHSTSTGPAPVPKEYQSFQSRPELRPPDVTVSSEARTASGGDLFLAPYSGVGQYGPMILGEHGELIWFKTLAPAGTRAANFQVQSYEGKPVLTWWQDPLSADGSHTAGEVIANDAYQTIAVVRAGNGYQPDLHEFAITPQGTGLITVYDAIDCNLSAVGGPHDGAVADTLLQEIDLKTGLVMYEWHSLDHVPLTNSYNQPGPTSRAEPFDYFHINSIDVEQNGDLLVDSRNTWAAYDVDAKTGQVRWELGGRHSSFKLGPGAATAWQHDAIQQPDGAITFFDNGAFPQIHKQSRAIEVALNTQSMTATLVRGYEHENPLVAGSQGNVQALAGGDWMVGWGQAGYLSEVGPQGQVLFNAHLPPDWESYRTFVLPWSGHPAQPPALAARAAGAGHAGANVYTSWNGATEVASWRVLAGASASALKPVAQAAKSGFETTIAAPGVAAGEYVQAQALSAAGAVLGSSKTVPVAG
ncbi:MAG TPA: arylsulfotransferase family protein [Solirubrobacteraceae bacterium]|nr:arylsulfotransferase family protein [Solirubrobacteraceae bacterium]